VEVPSHEIRYRTISEDLDLLTQGRDLSQSIFLFHSPPHQTSLDKIETGGRMIDHVPLDKNVGSIAIKRLIEKRQPLLTLHGHIHESVRLTGNWRDVIGHTHVFSAAHDGPELCVVRFNPERLDKATRSLI
jgi:Icc-related predicted phosphoesterase